MKKIILLCSLIAINAQALTLDEAVKSANENSHELKAMRLETESAQWGETKAMAGYLPKLELGARHLFSERFEELEVPFAGDVFVMPAIQPYSSLGLSATLNIFNGFQTTNEMSAAKLASQASDYRLKRKEEQTRVEIRTLFLRALGSQILLDVAEQNIQTLQSHLSDVGARIRSGVSTRYDSLRVEVQLEEAQTDKVSAQSGVVVSRAKLFEAIGTADDNKPLVGKLPEDLARIDVAKPRPDSSSRTDRAALISERDQIEKQSRAAKAHWLPKVSLFGDYEWYNNINHSISESDERFKSAYGLGVQMSWNLFDGGASLASQRQAALANKIADERVARFDQNMPVAVEEAKRRFSYDVINYNAKLSSIRKAEEAVRLAKGGVKAGTRTNTEVLDAVMDLNRAKASAVKSQIDAVEALGQLELSLGYALL